MCCARVCFLCARASKDRNGVHGQHETVLLNQLQEGPKWAMGHLSPLGGRIAVESPPYRRRSGRLKLSPEFVKCKYYVLNTQKTHTNTTHGKGGTPVVWGGQRKKIAVGGSPVLPTRIWGNFGKGNIDDTQPDGDSKSHRRIASRFVNRAPP